jgi:hypothetical protein
MAAEASRPMTTVRPFGGGEEGGNLGDAANGRVEHRLEQVCLPSIGHFLRHQEQAGAVVKLLMPAGGGR